MANLPVRHIVYTVLHAPLTYFDGTGYPIARSLFGIAVGVSMAVFWCANTTVGGVLVFALLYAAGCWMTKRDPQLLALLAVGSCLHAQYDPAVYEESGC